MTTSADRDIVLDRFQIEAAGHIDEGRSVLVAAPTGAGKTFVAEHAVDMALRAGERAFYTAPIKALSNQKFHDFSAHWGADRVGLLTGDNVVNPDADVVVMTTEVLRNMLYTGRVPARLSVVVLDEVHYIEDSFRGPVWEEVILNLPASVTLVCLSATVSNTDELGGWIESVRGPTGVVVETERPVALTNLYAVGDRRGDRLHVIPIHIDDRPNPDGHGFDSDRGRRQPRRHRPRQPWRTPGRPELVDHLVDRDLLPAIWFVFSRNGCDEAAAGLARAGVRLTDTLEAARIRAVAEERLARLESSDLDVLDADRWLATLERGIAAHHAGLVPAFKEAVEQCFVEGLVRVVFATETLALGVNLPARSVVVDRLSKFTGESHEPLTPGQFTQLTGRAGRRGLDERGHALVPWSPFTTFAQVSALAGSRSFRLRSAFRPTYNMAANLLTRLDPEAARGLLGRSFAQFQADADVTRLEQRLARERERLELLRREIDARPDGDSLSEPAEDDAIAEAVSRLRPGDIVADEDGERLVVLGVSWRRRGRARVRLLDSGAHDVRWELAELAEPPVAVTRIELPTPMAPEQPWFRSRAAGALKRAAATSRPPRSDRRRRSEPDLGARLRRVAREVEALEKRTRRDEASIARRFDAVVAVLRERGQVDGWDVSESGRLVGRIYHDLDLLVAETIAHGLLDDLDPPTLASVASVFTYEHRSAAPPPPVWFPSRIGRRRFDEIERLAKDLRRVERRHDVPGGRAPDSGFATVAHRWADGHDLSALLDDELSAGDFVRNVKQLIDLLRQISTVAPVPATRSTAGTAADSLHRGVVAISGALGE